VVYNACYASVLQTTLGLTMAAPQPATAVDLFNRHGTTNAEILSAYSPPC
jgi:hypothetical protein